MDPMCGWCFGFSPVMKRFSEEHPQYQYRVIPGGMITGSRVAPISGMAGYILGAYKRVEEYSGVKFGEPYLDVLRQGTEISNSEPSCRAIQVFQKMHPERAIAFAHAVQDKIFKEGKSWNEETTFRELAIEFGIDAESFIRAWNSEEAKYETLQEFQWTQAAGITGFPCVVVQRGDNYFMAAQGFTSYEQLDSTINAIVTEEVR